jgi:hypothetical protein
MMDEDQRGMPCREEMSAAGGPGSPPTREEALRRERALAAQSRRQHAATHAAREARHGGRTGRPA